MFKKSIAILLTLVMLVGLFSVTAVAAEPSSDVYWKLDGSVLCLSNTSYSGDGKDIVDVNDILMPWYENRRYVRSVVVEGDIYPLKTQCWFSELIYCSSMDLSKLHTENVTTMLQMFNNCKLLKTVDVSGFNTSNVTNMKDMFAGCDILTSLDLSSFDTSKVTKMSGMFFRCQALTSIDISSFDTSNVVDSRYIFTQCDALERLVTQSKGLETIELPCAMVEKGAYDGVSYAVMPSGGKVLVLTDDEPAPEAEEQPVKASAPVEPVFEDDDSSYTSPRTVKLTRDVLANFIRNLFKGFFARAKAN